MNIDIELLTMSATRHMVMRIKMATHSWSYTWLI